MFVTAAITDPGQPLWLVILFALLGSGAWLTSFFVNAYMSKSNRRKVEAEALLAEATAAKMHVDADLVRVSLPHEETKNLRELLDTYHDKLEKSLERLDQYEERQDKNEARLREVTDDLIKAMWRIKDLERELADAVARNNINSDKVQQLQAMLAAAQLEYQTVKEERDALLERIRHAEDD